MSENIAGLTVGDWRGDGYKPVVTYGNWCCAILNHAEKFDEKNLSYVERHPNTDEVFVLLEGEAELLIGMEMKRVKMERGKMYNVSAGTYHQIITRPGTRVMFVESADVVDEVERLKG